MTVRFDLGRTSAVSVALFGGLANAGDTPPPAGDVPGLSRTRKGETSWILVDTFPHAF